MADGEFLRGEVYWVCLDDSVGGEERTGRPAVVISSNGINEKQNTVVVAFITTSAFASASRPSIVAPNGTKRRVMCDQIRTVDKSRLDRYDSTLDESELIRVTGALAATMGIPVAPPKAVATAPKKEPENDAQLLSLKAECDMWHKLYEKTMDQLVDVKMAADMARKTESAPKVSDPTPPPKEEEPPKAPEVPEEEQEPEKYEINTCSVEDLMKCGCTLAMARLIVSYRPYKMVGDLRRVPGVKAVVFGILKQKVYCVPLPSEEKPKVAAPVEKKPEQSVPKKANVNTATAKELHEIAGISMTDAYGITAYRKKIGVYKCLEDLLQAPRYTEGKLKKHRSKLEV